MARVQYGSIITQIKGAIGGTVFQKGNFSYVMRNKGYSRGKTTSGRQAANVGLVQSSVKWRTLSNAQRDVWNTRAVDWPFTDKFGNIYTGSGYQVFVAFNAARISIDEEPVSAMPALDPAVNVGPLAIDINAPSTFLIQTTNDGDSNQRMQVFASAPLSRGRYSSNTPVKLIATLEVASAAGFDVSSAYEAVFGVIPSGTNIIVRTVQRNRDWTYPYYPTFDVVQVFG